MASSEKRSHLLVTKRKSQTIAAELRRAIADSGETLYRVAKDSGVDYSTVYRFMSGKQTLTLDTADKLAAYLGLRLTTHSTKGR